MKPFSFITSGALLLLLSAACHNQNTEASTDQTNTTDTATSLEATSGVEQPENVSTVDQDSLPVSFDRTAVAISDADLGVFPYLSAPESYKFREEKTKDYEEKYFFFAKGEVLPVVGEYFHAQVFAQEGTEFSETYLRHYYEATIKKLGGVEIYTGYVPFKATSKITTEQPSYTKDLYDYQSTTYNQFFIRTADENIWIELNYGNNARLVDLTVVREATAMF